MSSSSFRSPRSKSPTPAIHSRNVSIKSKSSGKSPDPASKQSRFPDPAEFALLRGESVAPDYYHGDNSIRDRSATL